nr:unnamed protein product [Callosobruchus analis]
METIPVVESDGDDVQEEEEEKAPYHQQQQQQLKLPIRAFRPRRLSFSTPPVDIKQNIIDSINSGDYTALESDDDDGGGGGAKAHRARNLAEESLMEYLDQYDPLPRKYIREMYEDDERKETDHQYGVRLDTTVEKFKIGDSQLDIVGSDVYVKGKRYKGTQGLYELLFKKYPNKALFNDEDVENYRRIVYKTNAHRRHHRRSGQIAGSKLKYPNKALFNDEDVENYRRIVYKTNAHRRHHRRSGQIAGSKLEKYKRIIAPIASTAPTTSGGGGGGGNMMTMMEMTNNKKDYIYWDDPNELVDRLRLLLASQEAGHTGHVNEINSLIEELREAKVIE